MAGRHSLHAVVLFAVILHAIAISQIVAAGAGRPEVHPDRPRVPDASLGRRGPRLRLPPSLPGPDRRRRAAGRLLHGPGPAAWRTAAQIVAVIASIGLILPIYGLTCMLFDRRIASHGGGAGGLAPACGRARPRHAQR